MENFVLGQYNNFININVFICLMGRLKSIVEFSDIIASRNNLNLESNNYRYELRKFLVEYPSVNCFTFTMWK